MKKTHFSLALMVAVCLPMFGCGEDPNAPPASAMAPRTSTTGPARDPAKPWTKQEKIDAINKAPISADEKKTAIAKVNAEG